MWLLHSKTQLLKAFEGSNVPRYAILSHRWNDIETSFKDVKKQRHRDRPGFDKINQCCAQAIRDKIDWVWIDTCCINKDSSAELSEAINSMFKWYEQAEVCYAYLGDMASELVPKRFTEQGQQCVSHFTDSVWFTRGWTLQELLAPTRVHFYDRDWMMLGTRKDLAEKIAIKTNIPRTALLQEKPLSGWTVADRMMWASSRETTRIEDAAYSLLGIFGVNMPLLYGEGHRAFLRLQEEIMSRSTDSSIFLFPGDPSPGHSLTASSPKSWTPAGTSHNKLPLCTFDQNLSYTWVKSGIKLCTGLWHYRASIEFLPLAYTMCDGQSLVRGILLQACQWFQLDQIDNVKALVYRRVSLDGCMVVDLDFPTFYSLQGTDYLEIEIATQPAVQMKSVNIMFPWYRPRLLESGEKHHQRLVSESSRGFFRKQLDHLTHDTLELRLLGPGPKFHVQNLSSRYNQCKSWTPFIVVRKSILKRGGDVAATMMSDFLYLGIRINMYGAPDILLHLPVETDQKYSDKPDSLNLAAKWKWPMTNVCVWKMGNKAFSSKHSVADLILDVPRDSGDLNRHRELESHIPAFQTVSPITWPMHWAKVYTIGDFGAIIFIRVREGVRVLFDLRESQLKHNIPQNWMFKGSDLELDKQINILLEEAKASERAYHPYQLLSASARALAEM